MASADERVTHQPEHCDGCGGDLADAEQLEGGERRQVFDLPEGKLLRVTEHLVGCRRCGCGQVSAAAFGQGLGRANPLRAWGAGARRLSVRLPAPAYERAAQALADLAGAAVSTGTPQSWVEAAASGLGDFR